MITLNILLTIWGIISFFKIKQECAKKKISFNALEAPFFVYLGFISGLTAFTLLIIQLSVKYLP